MPMLCRRELRKSFARDACAKRTERGRRRDGVRSLVLALLGLWLVAADVGFGFRVELHCEWPQTRLYNMLFHGGGGGSAASTWWMLVRHFSRKRSEDVRRINPKVPREQAKAISESLYKVIKQHGPISVPNTWNLVKESGINGLNSKTHMKIILKWMRGRKMLKLFCTHHGSTKRFLHSTLPEESQTVPALHDNSTTPSSETPKSSKKDKLRIDYKRLLEPVAN